MTSMVSATTRKSSTKNRALSFLLVFDARYFSCALACRVTTRLTDLCQARTLSGKKAATKPKPLNAEAGHRFGAAPLLDMFQHRALNHPVVIILRPLKRIRY